MAEQPPHVNERDRPRPQSPSDRPVHGDKLKDPKATAATKKDLPKRSHDMDQPGMNPEDEP